MLITILVISLIIPICANADLDQWDAFLRGRVRESSFPFISGDSFRAIANHIYDETNKTLNSINIKHKDIVFVRTSNLAEFFANIHPKIINQYILITHNSDDSAPGKFEAMLDDEKIVVWFGQNPSIMNHKKFIPIPIGLANRHWSHGNINTFVKVRNDMPILQEKKYLLGINFRIGTKPDVRQPIFNKFSSCSFCKDLFNEHHETYLRNMAEAKLVISPRGNGLDCHRIWEALLMKTIPIVEHSMLDELLSDLPVLIIDNWDQVTQPLLSDAYEKFKNFDEFNIAKIYMPYWIQLIESYRNN